MFNKIKKSQFNTVENRNLFKIVRAKSRRIIKEEKDESWNDYVGTITCNTSVKEVWNKTKSIQGRTSR